MTDAPSSAPSPTAGPNGWIIISDFSPGIQQNISTHYPPGTAALEGTFRCMANKNGSLIPAPGKSQSIYPTVAMQSTNTLFSEQYRICGLHASSGHYWAGETIPNPLNSSEIFIATEYWIDDGHHDNGSLQRKNVYRYTRHKSNAAWESIWERDNTMLDYSPLVRPKIADFANQRTNNPNPDTLGPTVLCFVFDGAAQQFPDESNPFVTDTQWLPGDNIEDPAAAGFVSPLNLCTHQGRVVIFPLLVSGNGAQSSYISNEAFYWSQPNDVRTLDTELAGNYFPVVAGFEYPTGYGVIESLTSDELFLVKTKGGGVVVRGSLNNFSTSFLPYVRSTGFSLNRGTRSPIGFIYPVDAGGLWVWSSGDSSNEITPNMNPDFWRVPQTDLDGLQVAWGDYATQCDTWNNYVLIPNNFIFDTRTSALWRIDDTDEVIIHRWSTESRGRWAYGTPSGWRNTQDPAVIEYDITQPATSYSFQSQPLSVSIDRNIHIDEWVVVGHGVGTITLNISTREDPIGQDFTINLSDSTRIMANRGGANIEGTHISYRFISTGESSTGAPIIDEFRLHNTEGHLITMQLGSGN